MEKVRVVYNKRGFIEYCQDFGLLEKMFNQGHPRITKAFGRLSIVVDDPTPVIEEIK